MLSLEQIRRLEQRVNEAVERINALENDKRRLKEQLTESRAQASKLEARLEQQSKDQAAIERGILAALEQLDKLEHEIADGAVPEATATPVMASSDDSFAGVEAIQDAEPPQQEAPPQQDQELDIF
ncbi:MAG: cell division protein ZapB [Spirochaetaceae bacterium]|nr:MAG: cell division protein ZapB [Spirochaetaceae bacterium]